MPQTSPHRPPVAEDSVSLRIGPAVTPMAFVRAMVLAYAARGMDPAQALRLAQIAPEEVSQPRARITAAQMDQAAREAINPDRLIWVVVGDAKLVKPQLDAVGLPVEMGTLAD